MTPARAGVILSINYMNKEQIVSMRLSKPLFALIFLFLILAMLLSTCGSQTRKVTPKPIPAVRYTPSPTVTVSPTVTALTPEATPAASVLVPVRLIIPRISVKASIADVGITSNGDLATPTKNPWDGVGWYSNGPRPGEEGSAVIDGHVDRPGGYAAIFWNLRYLQAGDTVLVINSQQQTLHFRVLRIASYPPDQAPVQSIFEATGGIYLNLITCTGTWIPSQHQTTLRLVVYTVMD